MSNSSAARAEVLLMVDGIEIFAPDLGLRSSEVERLIGVHGGVWPLPTTRRELWCPTDEQADRIACLCEVCASVAWLIGGDARVWLRRRNAGLGCSPIRFMLAGAESLALLRDALRAEQGRC